MKCYSFPVGFLFHDKDLRFRLRSFEFRRCGKVDKKNRRSLRSALVRHVQVTPQNVHHPRHHENGQRLAGNVGKPVTWVPGPTSEIRRLTGPSAHGSPKALNGILLFGLTTAILFVVIHRTWSFRRTTSG